MPVSLLALSHSNDSLGNPRKTVLILTELAWGWKWTTMALTLHSHSGHDDSRNRSFGFWLLKQFTEHTSIRLKGRIHDLLHFCFKVSISDGFSQKIRPPFVTVEVVFRLVLWWFHLPVSSVL
ncbi:hypothetical protein SAMN03159444_02262 [Pseudomonas sp. NFACC02]|nr:hypothetical protein SAMN03159444_02262 [Pseudomonas sp. NFACC02]